MKGLIGRVMNFENHKEKRIFITQSHNQQNCMKNSIKMLLVLPLLAILFSVNTAQAQANCNTGPALGAAHSNADFQQCITGWQGSFWELSVEVTASAGIECFYTVEAWICPRCNGNRPCSRIACRLISRVTVDENYNVFSVECFQ
jgi:hypothetical protein